MAKSLSGEGCLTNRGEDEEARRCGVDVVYSVSRRSEEMRRVGCYLRMSSDHVFEKYPVRERIYTFHYLAECRKN